MQIGLWLRRACVLSIVFVLLWLVLVIRSWRVPDFTQVKRNFRPSDVWLIDRNGIPLESIREGKHNRSLAWVEISDLAPSFVSLLKQAEDRRFDTHVGVDVQAFGRIAFELLRGQRPSGASTLTMQLISLLEARQERDRSIVRKLQQILRAMILESKWSKPQILEAYVNLVGFRGELVGLRAASFGYFQKHPAGLLQDEAALLVALLRSPNASSDRVAARACRLLAAEYCPALQEKAKHTFEVPYRLPRARELIPVVAKEFLATPKVAAVEGWVPTTLDAKIQRLARETLREQLHALQSQNVKDGAVLVTRTQTGEVLAYVANSGPGLTSATQIDGIKMRRQAGSTIKPFVYAAAFEAGLLEPNSLLEDTPLELGLPGGKVYRPRKYDYRFRGLVGAGEALGSSLNVPAVRVLERVGEARVLALLQALGIKQLASDDFYGHSLALGTVDISLWDLTQAYRQLGAQASPVSAKTRDQLFTILAAPEYRRFTFGLDSVLVLPFPSAVKTGTSQDMRDNWCVGWNDDYTVGVWVGNFDGKAMWHVSGVSGAAPVWQSLMKALPPSQVRPMPRYEPPEEPLPQKTLTRIRYPTPDMLVALDPDIPRDQQRLPIEVENPLPKQQLYLNDKLLGPAEPLRLWQIERGRYRLELRTAKGELMERLRFEVR